MILGTAFGGKLYIDNKKPEVIPVDNTIQIQLKTLSSEFYRFKKYEIEKDAINKRSHEIDINNLQKEFDAKVLLVADHLETVESKRVKDMLEFAESVKPKEKIGPGPEEIYTEKEIDRTMLKSLPDNGTVEINDTLGPGPDTLVQDQKRPFLKRVFGIFKRDTLK
jgi:hypothetical protein